MSEKLEQAKADYLTKLKKVKLAEAGVGYEDLDVYIKYINADDEAGIEKEAQAIVSDIEQQNTATDVYHDSRTWKPF